MNPTTKNSLPNLSPRAGQRNWVGSRAKTSGLPTKLKGKSIGGDAFGNREGRLPNGKRIWHEADLDYAGGRRGPKRIVYSNDGLRRITVDHYATFKEVPPCR